MAVTRKQPYIWKTLSSKPVLDTPWLKVISESCEIAEGKVIDPFYRVENPDWVLIIARTEEGQLIMVDQYRHGNKQVMQEFPAGMLDEGEDPVTAAQRELLEETGCSGGSWKLIRDFSVNPDRQASRYYIVFADGVVEQAMQDLDEHEELHPFQISIEEVREYFASEAEVHPHHLLAWMLTEPLLK